jgi:hypothetical protein
MHDTTDYINSLIDAYHEWLKIKSYPSLSADELLNELFARDPQPLGDIHWLSSFLYLWEEAKKWEKI